jgi:hypothetical protein
VSTEDAKITVWGPASALRCLLEGIGEVLPRPRPVRINRAIRAIQANATHTGPVVGDAATQVQLSILADYFGVPQRYFTDSTIAEEINQELQMRVLRHQFKASGPESLCPQGGMTRGEYIKFLTILRETIHRETGSGGTGQRNPGT